ncbi:MAG: Ig-like domain repeat protein [Acidobacteriota bacterium]|nr:Ig-like domain repeat protein [Acidobacteriota bacterium]
MSASYTPTVTTQETLTGTSAYDTATLVVPTGGAAPNGDVLFTLSGPNGYSQTDTVSSLGTPTTSGGMDTYTIQSTTFSGLAPGSYTFSATYEPGTNDVFSTAKDNGNNESFTVAQFTPTVSTIVYSGGQSANGVMSGGTAVTGPLTAPASVYDTSTVAGTAGMPAPTGVVDFALFQGGCPDGSTDVSPIWTGQGTFANGVWVSPQVTPALAAGSYYFASYYNGDNNYVAQAGPCEPFTVVSPPIVIPPSVTISTTPSPTGQSASDTATVTGSGSTPTGTVTFTLYTSTGTKVGNADTETLTNGSATSAAFTNLSPGNYYFVAVYSGDTSYGLVTGTPEPFVIAPLTPTVSTTPSVSGSSASDAVTVSGVTGQPTPGGVVTFTLYDSNGNVVGTDANVSLVNGQATSTTFSGLASGNYYFIATYTSTDGTYASSVGAQEPFSVTKVSPTKPPTKTPPYKIPSKAPKTGLGGSARSGQSGLVESLSALFVLMGLLGLVMTERRRRRA